MSEPDDDLTGRFLDLLGRAAKTGLDRASDASRRAVDASRRAADAGRHQLELRQARRDLDAFWIRLGKTAYRLGEGGELDHPAIHKAIDRINALKDRIEVLEAAEGPDSDEHDGP